MQISVRALNENAIVHWQIKITPSFTRRSHKHLIGSAQSILFLVLLCEMYTGHLAQQWRSDVVSWSLFHVRLVLARATNYDKARKYRRALWLVDVELMISFFLRSSTDDELLSAGATERMLVVATGARKSQSSIYKSGWSDVLRCIFLLFFAWIAINVWKNHWRSFLFLSLSLTLPSLKSTNRQTALRRCRNCFEPILLSTEREREKETDRFIQSTTRET